MAIPTEEQIEKKPIDDSDMVEKPFDPSDQPVISEMKPDAGVTGRAQEIPALLESDPPHEEHLESTELEQGGRGESEISSQLQESDDKPMSSAPQFSSTQSDPHTAAMQYLESPTTSQELFAIRSELTSVLETMQAFQGAVDQLSNKLDAVSTESGTMSGKINEIALNQELISSELESLVSGAGSQKVLSKTFLVCCCTVMIALAGFQIYTFMSLVQTDNLQTASGTKLIENFNGLNKKMAEYNANLAKVLAAPAQQATTQSQHAATETAGHEAAPQHATEAPLAMPLSEKLNRLRNGAVEKKLVRKETGDWFVYTKKIDECIADVEIINALNQAYKRLGRPLPMNVPMPAHNSLCILKPDGKGGTEIVMTQNFVQ